VRAPAGVIRTIALRDFATGGFSVNQMLPSGPAVGLLSVV
jgi:hypothetical protein